jgi:adenylosuccinate lyase
VLDSSLAILMRDALGEVMAGLDLLLAALKKRAEEHRQTPMIGRSHGIHAEPTTLGLVFAGFYAECRRNRRRLERARKTIAVGTISGAVGTYANLNPEVEKVALAALGLRQETVPTQVVARDRHAQVFNTLALVGAAVERIALQIRHWQRTEVGEAEEAFGKGQKGSSAMPHKKNPILSENLTGLARMLRSHAAAALENVALWHERDISHSSVERMIAPDATALADFMLRRAAGLVDGLVVHKARMMKNLEITGGLIFSESVMLTLVGTGLPRQKAYEMVQRNALKARDEGGDFKTLLQSDPEISARLPASAVANCFDLTHHLRHADVIFERAMAEGEQP